MEGLQNLGLALQAYQSLGATLSSFGLVGGGVPMTQNLGLLHPPSSLAAPYGQRSQFEEDLEESSEEDEDVEGETPKQRAAKLQNVARGRIKKAKALVEKRKKQGLKSYILRIDGTGRPDGLHRHLWKNLLRAWGKRVDPSIDTWKGQPAGEVDSIYNGLVS